MAKLTDLRDRINELLPELDKATDAYRQGRLLLTSLEVPEGVSTQGLGLTLTFDTGQSIPVPLPAAAELFPLVASSVNVLGNDVIRIWNEIYAVASQAKAQCDATMAMQGGDMPGEEDAPAGS